MSAQHPSDQMDLVKAEVPNTAFAGSADEKSHGHGTIDVTNVSALSDDGSEDVSEEDLKNLRRISGKIPWSAFTIAFVELCERFSYYGTTIVCQCTRFVPFTAKSNKLQSPTLFNKISLRVPRPAPALLVNLVLWAWVSELRPVLPLLTSSGPT